MPVIKSFVFCLEMKYAKCEIEKLNSFKAKIKNWSMGELQEWLWNFEKWKEGININSNNLKIQSKITSKYVKNFLIQKEIYDRKMVIYD